MRRVTHFPSGEPLGTQPSSQQCVMSQGERSLSSPTHQAFDVVIIGGGISGTAAAYELARHGVRVVLLEQGELASMASGWTLAGVRQSGRHPAELPLAMAAVRRWAGLTDELGTNVEYRREGNLRLARTPEQVPEIERVVATGRGQGLDLTFLPDNRSVREIAPAIAESVQAASFCPTDGHANPTKTVQAFADAATRHGATIMTGVTVTGIVAHGGRVGGVRTGDGLIAADTVVVAAGIHSGRLVASLGLALPLRFGVVAAIQTIPLPPLLSQVLGVAGADLAGRQQADGRLRFTGGGRPWERDLADLAADYEIVQPPAGEIAGVVERVSRVLPAFADAPIARVWGGLLDMTPDALPVLERTAVDGLVLAAGFSGHGFCLGPVTGQIIRELAIDGRSSLPIEPFRSDRFVAMDRGEEAATLHG
jgi:sarcosine oxidase subunit beta